MQQVEPAKLQLQSRGLYEVEAKADERMHTIGQDNGMRDECSIIV